MFETLSILPISFWMVIALFVVGSIQSFRRLNDGTGLATLAVLGTVAAWYVGDAFYNDYVNNHAKLFSAETLQGAWLQVAWFLLVFLAATPWVHRWYNAGKLHRTSGLLHLMKHGGNQPAFQSQLLVMFWGCVWIWIGLFLIALAVLQSQILYYLFPFLGYKASPWSHGRIGAGFDSLSIVATYLQILTATVFGVTAALATDRRIRLLASLLCLLSWPFFIFDRARNIILVITIPGLLCWVFLRLRGGMIKKSLVLLGCFLVVNMWMKFVIANRSDMSITAAFHEKGLNLAEQKEAHNEGLNMFEELCWINTFIENGSWRPNWGEDYMAQLVNPIPRGLWPGKPLIGVEYATLRGQGGADSSSAGIFATISDGVIGQGVLNFGRFLGPMAAALLMSFWVAVLARLDLDIQNLGRLPLFATGLLSTFNMGRDISFIGLYPFVFGALVIWWLDHYRSRHPSPTSGIRSKAHRAVLKSKSFNMKRTNIHRASARKKIRWAKNVPSSAKQTKI